MMQDEIFQNLIIVLAVITLIVLFKYCTRHAVYWKKLQVSGPKPVPFIGNIWDVLCLRISIGEFFKKLYESSDEPYVGFFIFDEPCLLIRSPDIVKYVLATDSKCFQDRTIANSKSDIFVNTIFAEKNLMWRNTRSILSPEFSSGRVKNMFEIVRNIGNNMTEFLKANPGNYDAKTICRKYSIDVIARCFFGVNAHSFDFVDSQFEQVGNAMFEYSVRNGFSQTMCFFKTGFVNLMGLQFFSKGVQNFFMDTWIKIAKRRQEMKLSTNDFVNTLRELHNKECFDDRKVAALCMEFFAAGFQAAASTMAFTLYEMAINPHIQEQLRKEIRLKVNKIQNLTEDSLNELTYLSMCIMETQRKYPSLPFLDRRCDMDYLIPGTNLIIKKGIAVYVSTIGIQNDEKYFSQPEKYNPKRFQQNVNEKELIYLPFGYGPRTCIGKRFGLVLVKLALVHLLSNFQVEKTAETPEPIQFEPRSFTTQSTVGLPIRFRIINHR